MDKNGITYMPVKFKLEHLWKTTKKTYTNVTEFWKITIMGAICSLNIWL